jgi:putative two-component system response regulator
VFKNATVLVVDDTPDNLILACAILKPLYRVKVANCGELALKIALSDTPPDLILLDVVMPEMDGYEVCRRLKSNPVSADIPILFLTAKTELADEEFGLELGAVDYIAKPISPSILSARVKAHLGLKRMRDFLKDQNHFLEAEVKRRVCEIVAVQDVTVHALASLAETRDSDTGNHLRRTKFYVRLLAEHLRHHPRFQHFLDHEQVIETLFKSAPLHDIGKVGVPDRILLKPGRLEPDEFEIMKTHTTLGYEAIHQAEVDLGADLPFLRQAKEIALYHQEKWDGSGYPEGLKGDEIPISARLMAVADVYDALVSRRVYKEPMEHQQAREIMLKGRGSHFDPDILDAFVTLEPQFLDIARRYQDDAQSLNQKASHLAKFQAPEDQ